MHLVPIDDIDPSTWDRAIAGYATKLLFHESAWLDFLQKTQSPGRILRLRIEDSGGVYGYFCGLLIRKGPFLILGSPLRGTTTAYMGPIAHNDLDKGAFLQALLDYCRRMRISLLELRSPFLYGDIMRKWGFEEQPGSTLVVTLGSDPEALFASLDKKTRYYIRKGPRDGMLVEVTQDPALLDEYYTQLIEVFGRRGLVPTYPPARVKQLYQSLGSARLLMIRASLSGRVLATGLFVHDDRFMYFWGGASHTWAYPLYPNEPIQWRAISVAMELGLQEYDMQGVSHFKAKFGGHVVSRPSYIWYASPVVRLARQAYRERFLLLQKLKWVLEKSRHKVNERPTYG